jgi:hypothetical protein
MNRSISWLVLVGCVLAIGGCSDCGSNENQGERGGDTAAPADSGAAATQAKASGGDKVLLVAQSTFRRNDEGRYTEPEKARLYILRNNSGRWDREEISETESNVYHKGMILEDGESPAVLTIGGNQAALKLWRRQGDAWTSETLWQPTFGGEHNRLRDVELGDVTGDGRQEIVIATHDQGVVAVLRRNDSGWETLEIDRAADTFVHEIELGDVDGDGTAEIYATPSDPNRGSGGSQGGKVTRYRWTGEAFEREVVSEWEHRHVKEILVTDLDGDGTPELYASLEGETAASGELGGSLVHPVEIVRLSRGEDGWTSEVVGAIPGERLCRFLVAGDLDGDGQNELIASSFMRGIWMFEPGDSLPFQGRELTRATGGFEHATLLADMDGDNAPELYVADDTHGRLVRFTWQDGNLSEPEVILTRTVASSAITWNLWIADLPR